MNDQTAQDPQQQNDDSYVNQYVPPTSDTNDTKTDLNTDANDGLVFLDDDNQDQEKMPEEQQNMAETAPKENDDQMADVLANQNDDMPADMPADQAASDEDLEAQNIFFLLDAEDGTDELKEEFLGQLQEVIWDDFLKNDVELLLTQEEMTNFNDHYQKVESATGEEKDRAKDTMVEFLEKLIPDLEEIMLEKALDLKSDLFAERIKSMKEVYEGASDKLAEISKAEELMYEDKWKSAAQVLNKIEASQSSTQS